jgi:ribulose-bisphosphate carboxylase large chain
MVLARNEGRDVAAEGADLLRKAAKHSPELRIALETWQDVSFEFEPTDALDMGLMS